MLATWAKSSTSVKSYVYCTPRPCLHVSVFCLKTFGKLRLLTLRFWLVFANPRKNPIKWLKSVSEIFYWGHCAFSGAKKYMPLVGHIWVRNAIVFQNLRSRRSSRVELNGVFKNFLSRLRLLDKPRLGLRHMRS